MVAPPAALGPAPAPKTAGRVIALEGLDGSGTTTQAARLAAHLERRGYEVERAREPTRGVIGRMIREALAGAYASVTGEALAALFAADRLEHHERVVGPALARGAVVLTDRSVLSSLAYQVSDLGGGDDAARWVAALNARAPLPHLSLWLDVAPSTCIDRVARRGAPRERFEQLEALAGVREQYAALCARGLLRRVDGSGSEVAVFDALWATIEEAAVLPTTPEG